MASSSSDDEHSYGKVKNHSDLDSSDSDENINNVKKVRGNLFFSRKNTKVEPNVRDVLRVGGWGLWSICISLLVCFFVLIFVGSWVGAIVYAVFYTNYDWLYAMIVVSGVILLLGGIVLGMVCLIPFIRELLSGNLFGAKNRSSSSSSSGGIRVGQAPSSYSRSRFWRNYIIFNLIQSALFISSYMLPGGAVIGLMIWQYIIGKIPLWAFIVLMVVSGIAVLLGVILWIATLIISYRYFRSRRQSATPGMSSNKSKVCARKKIEGRIIPMGGEDGWEITNILGGLVYCLASIIPGAILVVRSIIKFFLVSLWPVTRFMISILAGYFGLFIGVIGILYVLYLFLRRVRRSLLCCFWLLCVGVLAYLVFFFIVFFV